MRGKPVERGVCLYSANYIKRCSRSGRPACDDENFSQCARELKSGADATRDLSQKKNVRPRLEPTNKTKIRTHVRIERACETLQPIFTLLLTFRIWQHRILHAGYRQGRREAGENHHDRPVSSPIGKSKEEATAAGRHYSPGAVSSQFCFGLIASFQHASFVLIRAEKASGLLFFLRVHLDWFSSSRENPNRVSRAQGDAEDLPFETDSKDRYVSAGSIEYWPEPQRGICEVCPFPRRHSRVALRAFHA